MRRIRGTRLCGRPCGRSASCNARSPLCANLGRVYRVTARYTMARTGSVPLAQGTVRPPVRRGTGLEFDRRAKRGGVRNGKLDAFASGRVEHAAQPWLVKRSCATAWRFCRRADARKRLRRRSRQSLRRTSRTACCLSTEVPRASTRTSPLRGVPPVDPSRPPTARSQPSRGPAAWRSPRATPATSWGWDWTCSTRGSPSERYHGSVCAREERAFPPLFVGRRSPAVGSEPSAARKRA